MSAIDPRLGSLLDRRYRILERVGEGGAGVVYRALHEEMDRPVAIKVLHPELFPSPVALARFRREARAAGALVHSHAVTVFDFGRTEEGEPYLAMEYCDGGALSDRIAVEGALPAGDVVSLLAGLAAAVDAAHRQGIVHRDLKPGNILFAGAVAKVADFGLARMLESDDPGLTGGHAIGSPFYMSPEQCQGRPAGTESDIYSLGVIVYTLLTGEVPFRRGTAQEVLLAHLTEEPRAPQTIAPRLGSALSRAVLRALAKNPQARPRSAGELHSGLLQALSETTLDSPMPAMASHPAGVPGAPLVPLVPLVPLAQIPPIATPTHSSPSGPAGGPRNGSTSRPATVRVRRAVRDRSTGIAPEPIGRGEELALLHELLEAAANGNGQLVTIAGEPGAGKSTLAHAFLRRARMTAPGARLALGRSPEQFGSAEAYSPFLDALGNLLGGGEREALVPRLLELAPTWAVHFPGVASEAEAVAGETLAGMRSRDRMPREFAAFVAAISSSRPLVLLLEDLQWADPASIDLLAYLAPRLDTLKLMLVATYRPADVESQGHPLRAALASFARGNLPWSEIAPAPFAEVEVAAFLTRELGATPPRELVDFALRRTEGNPLFLLNVLNHLLQSGAVARDGDRVILARSLDSMDRIVPEGMVALIRDKVDRLDEGDRRLLTAASVEGLEFTGAVVAQLTERDEMEIEERLRTLQSTHRLVEPIGELELAGGHSSQRYRFVHSLYQHAFYDALAPKRRAAKHLLAAEALTRLHAGRLEPLRVALALHCEMGRDFARAIEHTLAAAELAAARNPRDARPLLAKALALTERLPAEQSAGSPASPARRAELLIRIGRHDAETAEFAGDVELYARAEQAVSEALAIEPGSVEARTVLGLIHLERGENERAFLDFARALEREPGHAAAWDGLSYLFKNTGFWSASLAAQQRAAGLDSRFAHSIRRLSVLIYEGRLDEARDEATALVRRRPKFAHYNYWRGIAAWYAGAPAESRHWIEQAYALDPADPIAQCVLAFTLAADGEPVERERARELLRGAEPGAAADGTFTYWIAKVHALLGDTGAALDWIRKAAKLGYWDAPWMRKDTALAALHGLPEFAALADEIESRQRAFRAFVEKESPAGLGLLPR